MTSSSERTARTADAAAASQRRPTPAERLHGAAAAAQPQGAMPPSGSHARFIPREEVGKFAAWTPGSFGATGAAAAQPQAAAAPSAEAIAAQVQAARQSGYQDGYRDGLVALEGFKQSYAQQITAQVGLIAQNYQARLDTLEAGLAVQVAEVAIALARQVVRGELAQRPELVVTVAQEALAATLVAAKQIAVHVHPDDHALIGQQAGEALAARGARLVADPALTRGGVVVDSEVGVIDASVEARWRRATAAMGRGSEFTDAEQDGDALA